MIFSTFYKVNNPFLHQSYLKSPLREKIKKIPEVPSSALYSFNFAKIMHSRAFTAPAV